MTQLTAPKAVFNHIIELISVGEVQQAESICRDNLVRYPRDINILGLMGAVLIKTNQQQEAEHYLRQTIDIAPTFAKPHEDLGTLLLATQRVEEAVPLLERATHLDPTVATAFFRLGQALGIVGRGKEADEAFEMSFKRSPVTRALAEAAELQKAGQFDEAQRIYRKVLKEDPNNVDALRMLAKISVRSNRNDEAERLLRRVIVLAPDYNVAYINLGRLLQEQDRLEEAIEVYRKAIDVNPNNAQAHYLLAGALAPAAQTYEAVASYQKCFELNPQHAGSLLGLGHVLKTIGRQEEGIQAYRDCIELKPENGETYWSLANLKTFRFTDSEIEEMEHRIENDSAVSEQSKVNFHFALGKAFEDRAELENAWSHYESGNSIQRQLVNYDPVRTEVSNEAIISVYDEGLITEKAGLGSPDPAPIFILGMPRSGSTLIEQILASHSMVEGTSELPYLARVASSLSMNRADGINYPEAMKEIAAPQLCSLGDDYLRYAEMHRVEGKPRFIDKMPNNFPNVGFIHLVLPNAKIIDARRHPLDACLGNYRQLYAKGQSFSYDMVELGEYCLQYHRIMERWNEVMPGRVLRMQYENTVNDFEKQVRSLLDYCELPFEDACLHYYETDRAVRTASSEQVRQPIYSNSLSFWCKYESHLDELKEVLTPILDDYEQYVFRQ